MGPVEGWTPERADCRRLAPPDARSRAEGWSAREGMGAVARAGGGFAALVASSNNQSVKLDSVDYKEVVTRSQ